MTTGPQDARIPPRWAHRLHPRAVEALERALLPGETVEVVVPGPAAQVLVGTDRRVLVFKKGLAAGTAFGSELSSWEYRQLSGVLLRTGVLGGVLALQVPGVTPPRPGSDEAYTAPYAIPVVRPYEPVQEAVAHLRDRVARAGDPAPADAPEPLSPVLVADELAKLARLRDDGVLTPEEFAHQKRRLLGL